MPNLSDKTYAKYLGHKNQLDALYKEHHVKIVHAHEETPPKTGQIIYTPHDCQFPDPWETPIGAIWECHGYRDGRCCYDQWIVVSGRGSRHWELFKRNL